MAGQYYRYAHVYRRELIMYNICNVSTLIITRCSIRLDNPKNSQIGRSYSMLLRRFYISLFIALGLFTFFLSPIATSGHASGLAYTNPITVTARTYTVHFPAYIDLKVSASDPVSTITRASIVIDFSVSGAQEEHPISLNKPGNSISVSWREDTTGRNFIPPGTQVDYFWEFWDSAGNTLTDTQQQFSTVDTRFSWQHLTRSMLQVNCRELLLRISECVPRAIPKFPEVINLRSRWNEITASRSFTPGDRNTIPWLI